jgi:hypothetical protein
VSRFDAASAGPDNYLAPQQGGWRDGFMGIPAAPGTAADAPGAQGLASALLGSACQIADQFRLWPVLHRTCLLRPTRANSNVSHRHPGNVAGLILQGLCNDRCH